MYATNTPYKHYTYPQPSSEVWGGRNFRGNCFRMKFTTNFSGHDKIVGACPRGYGPAHTRTNTRHTGHARHKHTTHTHLSTHTTSPTVVEDFCQKVSVCFGFRKFPDAAARCSLENEWIPRWYHSCRLLLRKFNSWWWYSNRGNLWGLKIGKKFYFLGLRLIEQSCQRLSILVFVLFHRDIPCRQLGHHKSPIYDWVLRCYRGVTTFLDLSLA